MSETSERSSEPEAASAAPENEITRPQLSAAAQRALAEADERRKKSDATAAQRPKEVGGRDGPDPARFGDWEKGGIASDF